MTRDEGRFTAVLAALHESEARWRSLVEQSPDLIMLLDREGGIQFTNRAMPDLSKHEVIGRPMFDFFPWPLRERAGECLRKVTDTAQSCRYLTEYHIKEHQPRFFDVRLGPVVHNGEVLAVISTCTDITERRRHELALQKSEELHRVTLSSVSDAVFLTDDAGCWVYVCPNVGIIFGYSEKEVWEMENVSRLLGHDLVDPCELRAREEISNIEREVIDKTGTTHVLLVNVKVVDIKGGTTLYTCRDITEQRRAEGKARRHLDEASRLQRLQVASELATVLAHELNQPLGAIATFADAGRLLLEHAFPDREKLAENLRRISEESLRGGEIIQHLRGYIRKGEAESVSLNLNEVARHAGVLIEPKAKDGGIRLIFDLCETPLPVKAVKVHLEQVLLNLLGNAIEAILDARMTRKRVTVETRRSEHVARVTVRDDGPGIDAEVAAKLFAFLHSTKDYGLGVGLRISRSLVEAHGGRLWIEPQTPGGIVHFEIPLAP